jgi:hypothetical protein
MAKQKSIIVQNVPVQVITENDTDYICITDMANAKENESRAADIIKNWIRNRYTLEFLGNWEQMYNPNFKVVEFDHFNVPFFISDDLKPDTIYQFQLNFVPGCYEMIFYDLDGNGVKLNNNLPVLRIRDQKKNTELKRFEPDSGTEIREQSMIFR